MTREDSVLPGPPGASEAAEGILNQWADALTQVLESMTDQRPQVVVRAAGGGVTEPAPDGVSYLWWEQPFSAAPGALAWIGAPQPTWEQIGTLTLQAAGLDTTTSAEARNTWLEIVGQSLSAMARALSGLLGHEVTCGSGTERPAPPESNPLASVAITLASGPQPPMLVAFSPELRSLLAAPPPTGPAPASAPAESMADGAQVAVNPRTMGLLLDVDLPVSISFGKTRLPMKEVLKLTTGSIVELDRDVNDPVEVLVNRHLIARGEVVVVDGNYGVKIQEIASRHERLRSIP